MCDVNELDKVNTFYGEHYLALYVLKKTYDPWGLMSCSNCVGTRTGKRLMGGCVVYTCCLSICIGAVRFPGCGNI